MKYQRLPDINTRKDYVFTPGELVWTGFGDICTFVEAHVSGIGNTCTVKKSGGRHVTYSLRHVMPIRMTFAGPVFWPDGTPVDIDSAPF